MVIYPCTLFVYILYTRTTCLLQLPQLFPRTKVLLCYSLSFLSEKKYFLIEFFLGNLFVTLNYAITTMSFTNEQFLNILNQFLAIITLPIYHYG